MSISSFHSEVASHVSTLGIIHAVGASIGAPSAANFLRKAEEFGAGPVARFGRVLEQYCALPVSESIGLRDRIVMNEKLYEPEALNLWLSAFSARTKPPYPFVESGGVDRVALLHPFLRSSRALIGGVVMLRLYCGSRGPGDRLWPEIENFLAAAWTSEPCGTQMARASMLGALSDKLYFRSDLVAMAKDQDEKSWVGQVVDEFSSWIAVKC